MPTIGETLQSQAGPLPVWVWAVGGTAAIGGYLWYRQKKQASQAAQAQQAQGPDQSNLGTVPVSNLTTQAQPMPIQLGDTFVNVPEDEPGKSPSSSGTRTVAGPFGTHPMPGAANLQPAGVPAPPPAPVPPPPASAGQIPGTG